MSFLVAFALCSSIRNLLWLSFRLLVESGDHFSLLKLQDSILTLPMLYVDVTRASKSFFLFNGLLRVYRLFKSHCLKAIFPIFTNKSMDPFKKRAFIW
ncbi:uncharacterized protein BYT42DRAFT_145576 [Radiomyces spectabilis]|uniref:uncharacterized protein n=1 Tax=Radiomyces spectabilis TaxID=64574 RepID=UPI002220095E|nr:uncharacterized protein BYT42DRAFT_145576 [Radiomyces spectabilis]KAI8365917.1 hypothetical protein BYT42DRAFT_145576 [Radiomyces spectabilis]